MTLEQTTIKPDDIDNLLNIIQDQKQQIRAMRIRIAFLEKRLEQREETTLNFYEKTKPYFPEMRRKVMEIFLSIPASIGLSHREILEEWRKRFPKVNDKNVPRRVRELVTEGRLWSTQDPDGKARFYLKLRD